MKPNGEIKIEKGIPVSRKGHSSARYPFATMEIGDSFFVVEKQTKLSSLATGFARRNGGQQKFTTRQVEGGVRVWRIA